MGSCLHGQPCYPERRLSRARWRPAWRVRCRYINACYDARALGDAARMEAAERVAGKRRSSPPLTDKQLRAIPSVLAWQP